MHQLWRKRKICSVFFSALPLFFKIFCNGTRRYNEVPLRNNSYYQSIKKFFDIYTKRTVVLRLGCFVFRAWRPWKFRGFQTTASFSNSFPFFFFCVKPQCEWLWYVVQAKKSPVQRFQRRRFSKIYFKGNAAGKNFFLIFLPLVFYEFNRVESARS